MKLPVEVTDKALEEILSIINSKNIPQGYHLRIGTKGGGCSGVTHYLGFDEKSADDLIFEHESIVILIKKKDFMHLIGMKLTFVDGIDARGFVFE
jgi:iron-sulfur cluster assembly protein